GARRRYTSFVPFAPGPSLRAFGCATSAATVTTLVIMPYRVRSRQKILFMRSKPYVKVLIYRLRNIFDRNLLQPMRDGLIKRDLVKNCVGQLMKQRLNLLPWRK